MKPQQLLLDFMARERLLTAAAAGLLATSAYLGRRPVYTWAEVTPIFLLLALFSVVKGIENSGFLIKLGLSLERGRYLPVKLVSISFILSMIVTIDVSLVTMIPLVLSLNVRQRDLLVILVALTAHVGAALTPFGTPQNLFIFSIYDVSIAGFIRVIAPFSLGMLSVFLLVALFLGTTQKPLEKSRQTAVSARSAGIYGALLVLVVLCVLKMLPPAAALLAIAYSVLFNRDSLKIDYALLVTFLCFIGLADNVSAIIASTIKHTNHVFILSSVLSQFISNVPTTLLLSKFTNEWEALLWGSNVGGFGSLMAALANLITYRLYVMHSDNNDTTVFALRFVIAGYFAFFTGIAIYFGLALLNG